MVTAVKKIQEDGFLASWTVTKPMSLEVQRDSGLCGYTYWYWAVSRNWQTEV